MAASNGLVWKIALGVFLGLSACGLVTCTVLGTMGYAIEQQRRIDAERPPLKPDERCVGKTRLQRVDNGWVQSGSCP